MFGPVALGSIADIRPPNAAARVGSGTLVATLPALEGGTFTVSFILTPRPPVTLYEAARATTGSGASAGWVKIAQVAEYLIPARPPAEARIVSTRFVIGRLLLTSPTGVQTTASMRVINLNDGTTRLLFPVLTVPASGFLDVPLRSAVLTGQDVLQIRALGAADIHVSLGYVNVTREPFTVIP